NHYPLHVDTTSFLWNRKREIYRETAMTLVAQSRWTMEQVRQSPLLSSKEVAFIPYGLDTELFRPVAKETARDILRLPQGVKILFFSAIGLDSPRKGWNYLRKALSKVTATFKNELAIVVAGNLSSRDVELGVPVINLGYVNDDRIMVLAYNAADIFVGASLF